MSFLVFYNEFLICSICDLDLTINLFYSIFHILEENLQLDITINKFLDIELIKNQLTNNLTTCFHKTYSRLGFLITNEVELELLTSIWTNGVRTHNEQNLWFLELVIRFDQLKWDWLKIGCHRRQRRVIWN